MRETDMKGGRRPFEKRARAFTPSRPPTHGRERERMEALLLAAERSRDDVADDNDGFVVVRGVVEREREPSDTAHEADVPEPN